MNIEQANTSGKQPRTDRAERFDLPMVTVVIPMKDERDYIAKCLESLINQDYPKTLMEIIVVDGGSTDGSLEIVAGFMKHHANIKLSGGPGINCPAGMNVGIKEAGGEVIAKVDAHGYIPSDYISVAVSHLKEHADVKCVGGPIRPLARGMMAQAGVFARSSVFGVGRGVYSMGKSAKFVDSVQCGLYKRDIFDKIGLFDEALQFGEDEEINWRIRKSGYKILSTPDITFYYFPRPTFKDLFKQYYNYGRLRVQVIRKHPAFFRLKHATPPLFVFILLMTALLSPFSTAVLTVFFGLLFLYLTVSVTVSAAISSSEGRIYLFLIPIAFGALHSGYGFGFLRGTFESIISCPKWRFFQKE